ncbi:MAG: Crp/Fnr family transcriptional regulator [Opitutae bacterium]|jgi:signal-transduction protein with cAMP-binding, CBS, and nucleotidyltransferase domain|nr:Crp/Fnr family transcriptional regulator [Opitutae bacterium]
MILSERALILKKTKLFGEASLDKLAPLAEALTERTLQDQEAVFPDSGRCGNLVVLARGAVCRTEEGKSFTLGEGDCLGEFALFDETVPRPKAKADGEAVVFVIDGNMAMEFIVEESSVAENFIRSLVRKIRSTD